MFFKYIWMVLPLTDQMLDVKSYVRDFYAYKRSQCPELILTKMDQTKGLEQLQRQVCRYKECIGIGFTIPVGIPYP